MQSIANCKAAWRQRYPAGEIRRVTTSGDGGSNFVVEARLTRARGTATVQCLARGDNDWAPTDGNDLYVIAD